MRARGRSNKPYLEDIKDCMEIDKYCDMKGVALDRREWFCLQGITFRV